MAFYVSRRFAQPRTGRKTLQWMGFFYIPRRFAPPPSKGDVEKTKHSRLHAI